MKHFKPVLLIFTALMLPHTSIICAESMKTKQPSSPDGQITVSLQGGGLALHFAGKPVIQLPRLGIGDDAIRLSSVPHFVQKYKADYTMLSGKCLHCTNSANEYSVDLTANQRMTIRLFNDGMAFRYELSDLQSVKIPREHTAYRIADGTPRWMQRWSEAYEGFFPLTTQTSDNGRWGYPALVEASDGVYALITEANIERRQSASSLYNYGDIYSVVPDKNDIQVSGSWHTPWRVLIIGTLSRVVESTLVTDVANPCCLDSTTWIHPGVVSWVYWAYNHGSNDYNIICKYVDLAVSLQLPYVLIDAEWDEMKNGKTIEDAVAYARDNGIKPLIWYNSSVGWVKGAPGPKYRLNNPDDREREFAWCERIGVAGVKIDFFSGDNQMNMDYYLDLLESTARHHLLVNFHGATIPRGWQRTYPHMLTTEGVYGAEWYNNVPTFTDKAASHNATLPFTRNVIGPMDYTPCAFSHSQHPHITTYAHELALTVLFESGLQHLADRPESFLAQPADIRHFFGRLPVVWDETLLLDGVPGQYVVLARRNRRTWYVAGINGSDDSRTITLSFARLPRKLANATLFLDGDNPAQPWCIKTISFKQIPRQITLKPRGGFVAEIEE